MVIFEPVKNLTQAAGITLANMLPYYQHYAVAWDETQIEAMTKPLVNLDIVLNDQVIGVMRLSFDADECYLRDLQVAPQYQNRGIGAYALAEAERRAKAKCFSCLKLRVFKISPAVNLYKRQGFSITNEDDRFYYMSREVA